MMPNLAWLDLAADIASWVLIVTGAFYIVVGAVGLIRMPDVYTRMHAASLIDSLGSALLIIGFILQAESSMVIVKLVMLYALLFFTTPVASHAVAQAALIEGIAPELAEDRRQRNLDPA